MGLYPPGTLVRLASGEAAIVLRRGATPQTPLAAALVNRSGEPMMNPARRDCAHAAHAIQAVLEPRQLRVVSLRRVWRQFWQPAWPALSRP